MAQGGPLWAQWYGHPEQLALLALAEVLYLLAVGPLRERYRLAPEADPRKVATFTLGILVLVVAVASPLHVLSEEYLFSAHMTQHVLMTLVAPPLLLLGLPDWLLRPLLAGRRALTTARVLTHPVVAFVAFNLVFSLWHIPALYETSVRNDWVHALEHVMFTGSGILMWWPLVSPARELPRLSYPLQMVYLFLVSVAQTIVFAPLVFSRSPVYDWYARAPKLFGLTPVTDQQVGAIIMKIGGGVILMGLIIILFYRWARREEMESRIDRIEREIVQQDINVE